MKNNPNKTLNEEIRRIKSLFYENFNKKDFVISGDVESYPGSNVKLMSDDRIGEFNLLNFEDAWDLDYYIVIFHNKKNECCKINCENDFFNGDNSLYLYSLDVDEKYRGLGHGKELMDKCHQIAKDLGYNYVLLITDCNNNVAQNMYKSMDYQLHQTDGTKDFYFKEIN
jgi:GNAT superfamily N-acetyltransferase